ncbi:DUF485 domain-containing protein [Nocardiopsis gilva YIM 90087]|uniref:DUF485 domain-containing protein n=2 Tax=Nocardiopsis gilva TaxID=280236 RepID=A0A223S8X5_9ACTN|nr:DUF485 domain-containing protein [Nocardiopsis gilva YIM 90087]
MVPEVGEVESFRGSGEQRGRAQGATASAVFASWNPQFVTLRRRSMAQMIILVSIVLAWYIGYLFMSAYQRDVMGHQVIGSVNVALIVGVGQFASTFVIAWAYGRYARHRLDPIAEQIRTGSDSGLADVPTAVSGKAGRP